MGEQFLVAERLGSGARQAAVGESSHFVDQAVGDHLVDALLDAPGLDRTVPAQPDLDDRRRRVGVETGPERAEREPAPLAHLQRAHDAPNVRRLDPRRGSGVELDQPRVERLRPERCGLDVEPGADSGPLPREDEAVDHRAVVEPGAAHQDRPLAAGRQVVEHRVVRALELGHRVLLRRLDQIDEMVRDRRPVGGCRLGGADVHAAVHLHRVDRQQLRVTELRRNGHRDGRLPRRGGPDDGHPARHPAHRRPIRWTSASATASGSTSGAR